MADSLNADFLALAAPLSDAEPCGVSLEYDADFLLLEEEAQGKPEVEYGDSLTQATPANWQQVMAMVLPLMARSRDLRLALYLTRAQLNLQGVEGFAGGLQLIEALLSGQWDAVHPQLDPDDDNDPLLRVNILASLCEAGGILQELRDAPLARARSLGAVSLRDLDLASGELPAGEGQEKPSLAVIEATFQEAGQDALAATEAALRSAFDRSVNIERVLTEKVGVAHSIDLSALSTMLRRAAEAVRQRLSDSVVEAPVVLSPAEAASFATPAQVRGEISNRDDVRLMLDKLCTYFALHEPTSPVPLLLQRARKLVDKSFIELLEDLAPDGLAQLALVSGLRNDNHDD
ncbi:type VI secretion system protein TssA [Pseudomonas gingeri]|uniref:type VI secretion system protein TssA n=1 Tax=Pseudomonas gingeri TaxID=117681 RepID=UPI0034E951B8